MRSNMHVDFIGQDSQEVTINQEVVNNDHQDILEQQQEATPKRTKEWIQKNHPSNQIIGDIN